MAGIYTPDTGSIRIDGRRACGFRRQRTPSAAGDRDDPPAFQVSGRDDSQGECHHRAACRLCPFEAKKLAKEVKAASSDKYGLDRGS